MVSLNLTVGLSAKEIATLILNNTSFPEGKTSPLDIFHHVVRNPKFKTKESIIEVVEQSLREFGKTATRRLYIEQLLKEELGYSEKQVNTLYELLEDYLGDIL